MYESYRDQVAGMSNEELARRKEAYKESVAGGGAGSSGKTPSGNEAATDTLRDQLFAPTQPEPLPRPEHPHERRHKR